MGKQHMTQRHKITVGIDPGQTGAIASICGEHANVWDIPTGVRLSGGKRRTFVDANMLADLLGLTVLGDFLDPDDALVWVEWAQASPQMGTVSAFRYGEGFGLIRGILAHLRVPVRLVRASQWKRGMGLVVEGGGDFEAVDKGTSLDLARKLYPQLAHMLERDRDNGRAEALLIAHYGCEQAEAAEKAS